MEVTMFLDEKAEGEPWQPESYKISKRVETVLLACVVAAGACMFLSVGHAYLGEVEEALGWFDGAILSLALGIGNLLVDVVLWWQRQTKLA